MAIAVTDFLRLALSEIRAARAGDTPAAADMADALLLLNEQLDAWNVDGRALYNVLWQTFTLIPNQQPQTIGLAANTPNFTVTVGRPAEILQANVILANNIRIPLTIVDDEQWGQITAGAATGQTPTIFSAVEVFLYYSPDWPVGNIYLWPVPNAAYGLEIRTKTLLAALAQTDTFDLPMGYQLALRLTLAEAMANMWGQPIGADLARRASLARAAVFGNNSVTRDAHTRDGGMPSGMPGGTFNHWTGMVGSAKW